MINYIEYDEETKRLAESLFNMLRVNGIIDDIYQGPWSSFPVEKKLDMYAIIDDLLEEEYDVDSDDIDDDLFYDES